MTHVIINSESIHAGIYDPTASEGPHIIQVPGKNIAAFSTMLPSFRTWSVFLLYHVAENFFSKWIIKTLRKINFSKLQEMF